MLLENSPSCTQRQPLFPGVTCFPLSPGNYNSPAEGSIFKFILYYY